MKFTVVLNGTDENPWHGMGLTQNPFPQIARHEVASHLIYLAALGGNPIPSTTYIRNYLKGWSREFVDLCCQQFRKGEIVEFDVVFPD